MNAEPAAAAHRGNHDPLPQPPSSTVADDITVIPVREMLPNRPDDVEVIPSDWSFEKIARVALAQLFPAGVGKISVRALGQTFANLLPQEGLHLTDLGRSIHALDRADLHWRELKQVNGEYPLHFIVRVCGLGERLQKEDKNATEVVH